jgi:hypothetical protein
VLCVVLCCVNVHVESVWVVGMGLGRGMGMGLGTGHAQSSSGNLAVGIHRLRVYQRVFVFLLAATCDCSGWGKKR